MPTVAVVGATGTTGSAIIAGLLSSTETQFTVTALALTSSVDKPVYTDLRDRGVKIVPIDLQGSEGDVLQAISGNDVLVSALGFTELDAEILLANAAKAAGVKRFLQSALMCVIPPRGVVDLREKKEDVFSHIQKIGLPYTYLDAGWWYNNAIPHPTSRRARNPSGAFMQGRLGADGNVPIALADVGDIGRYVAKVIVDPRTLNKRVFVYNEVFTQNQIYDLIERLTDEKIPRRYISGEESLAFIYEAITALEANPSSPEAFGGLVLNQVFYSQTIRGDNTPGYAEYLGYLDGKRLYPDFGYIAVEDYVRARV